MLGQLIPFVIASFRKGGNILFFWFLLGTEKVSQPLLFPKNRTKPNQKNPSATAMELNSSWLLCLRSCQAPGAWFNITHLLKEQGAG